MFLMAGFSYVYVSTLKVSGAMVWKKFKKNLSKFQVCQFDTKPDCDTQKLCTSKLIKGKKFVKSIKCKVN